MEVTKSLDDGTLSRTMSPSVLCKRGQFTVETHTPYGALLLLRHVGVQKPYMNGRLDYAEGLNQKCIGFM